MAGMFRVFSELRQELSSLMCKVESIDPVGEYSMIESMLRDSTDIDE